MVLTDHFEFYKSQNVHPLELYELLHLEGCSETFFFFNCDCGALQFQLHVQLLAIYFIAVQNVSSYYSFASVCVLIHTSHLYVFICSLHLSFKFPGIFLFYSVMHRWRFGQWQKLPSWFVGWLIPSPFPSLLKIFAF